MIIEIDEKKYPIEITYKRIKNMYLRIKDGPKIEITAPHRTTEKTIKDFINNNQKYIIKNILKKEQLQKVTKDCLLLELASKPGGFDLQAVEQLGLNYVPALGLPGKIAAKTSAKFLKNFIL